MNVKDFFVALSKRCEEGKCEHCAARNFCFTAPRSMTVGMINQMIDWMEKDVPVDKHMDMECRTP